MYAHEDDFYLNVIEEQKLLVSLADQITNPDYDYIAKLFQEYRKTALGDHNRNSIFKCLVEVVNNYNNSGCDKTAL